MSLKEGGGGVNRIVKYLSRYTPQKRNTKMNSENGRKKETKKRRCRRRRRRNALSSSCSLDKNDYLKINLINEPINLYQCVIDILTIKTWTWINLLTCWPNAFKFVAKIRRVCQANSLEKKRNIKSNIQNKTPINYEMKSNGNFVGMKKKNRQFDWFLFYFCTRISICFSSQSEFTVHHFSIEIDKNLNAIDGSRKTLTGVFYETLYIFNVLNYIQLLYCCQITFKCMIDYG